MKIVICTFNRSEYGPLRTLIESFKNDNFFDLKLVVGGAHLKQEYGLTKNEILQDGNKIDCEIDYLPSNSTDEFLLLNSTARLLETFSHFIQNEKPDTCLVLGDRFELLPVASACLMTGTILMHISGGEVTEGAIDNQVRHALTKMAHVHFVSNEAHSKNVIQMGEEAWRVCVSGEPALDYILRMPHIGKDELFTALNLNLNLDVFLVTFHSDTITKNINSKSVVAMLKEILQHNPQAQILATAANNDHGGNEINSALEVLHTHLDRFVYIPSLGQKNYYALLPFVRLMVGNTSSGIIEAQSFNVPVVNVGDRQLGRMQNINTLNAKFENKEILSTVQIALSEEFRAKIAGAKNIYGNGDASPKIINFIKSVFSKKSKSEILMKKSIFNN